MRGELLPLDGMAQTLTGVGVQCEIALRSPEARRRVQSPAVTRRMVMVAGLFAAAIALANTWLSSRRHSDDSLLAQTMAMMSKVKTAHFTGWQVSPEVKVEGWYIAPNRWRIDFLYPSRRGDWQEINDGQTLAQLIHYQKKALLWRPEAVGFVSLEQTGGLSLPSLFAPGKFRSILFRPDIGLRYKVVKESEEPLNGGRTVLVVEMQGERLNDAKPFGKMILHIDPQTHRLMRFRNEPYGLVIDRIDYDVDVLDHVLKITIPSDWQVKDDRERQRELLARQPLPEHLSRHIGQHVPDLTLRDREGNEVSLKSLRGKFAFVFFYSEKEQGARYPQLSAMSALAKEFKTADLDVVVANVDNEVNAQALRSLGNSHVPLAVIADRDGVVRSMVAQGLGYVQWLDEIEKAGFFKP
jgi:peroxiredoxin